MVAHGFLTTILLIPAVAIMQASGGALINLIRFLFQEERLMIQVSSI
jgi:hypothetical protein